MRALTMELDLEARPGQTSRAADIRRAVVVVPNHPALGVRHHARIEAVIHPLVQEDDLAAAALLGRRADQLDCARDVARFQGRLEAGGGCDGGHCDEVMPTRWCQSVYRAL